VLPGAEGRVPAHAFADESEPTPGDAGARPAARVISELNPLYANADQSTGPCT
jgi:hypothetical protein